ncbi:hypothetical protein [Allosphingosinicella sp.]|jgi:hypothetical protein|uniref:hypothetical protein n=1 Tax=Allosphingosinicella sp. TaxID=2823234 RepID=UPI002F0D488D
MTPEAKRDRAACIRECAAGFSDAVARTLIELAEGLEAEANELERAAAEQPLNRPPLA